MIKVLLSLITSITFLISLSSRRLIAQSLETMDVIPTLSSYCVWMITDRREELSAALNFEFKVAQDGNSLSLMYFVPDEKWNDIVRMSQENNKTQQILKNYDLEISIYLENISDIYQNAPTGKTITFALDGESVNLILSSRIIMLILSKDIIQNCHDDRVYLVVFAKNHSGYSEAFGLINGEIKYFKIVTPPCTPLLWGSNCNT
ncbi:hypothetical protein PCC8801_4473 (plasmid) [Rippkaea orientalis PCC 8801]|uniref:Uncharacterized protein n=1 Tax=Rippkaea orientalis (strain PCC 8801 / RF-1) TaxID=41431 RepID=B7K6H0_RIPO1|nr:hypothetical protein [Rippkaea orientalis]ACK68392.1 hypothetical protein PCC8801_4473 [Rippkaea orientalis PCC 8801]